MPNSISAQLLAEFYGQSSGDPLLLLITLNHPTFVSTIYLVNNTEDIVSRGNTYVAFPMTIRLPTDDGESTREAVIDFDNVSLELIDEVRQVTSPIDVKIEMVLASALNDVQIAYEELKIKSVSYTKTRISARLFMDDFLNVEMTSERYTPQGYAGLF